MQSAPPPKLPSQFDSPDEMITAEMSVFRTRLPRPVGVGRHLIVVALITIVALVLAIAFAERDVSSTDNDNADDNTDKNTDGMLPKDHNGQR